MDSEPRALTSRRRSISRRRKILRFYGIPVFCMVIILFLLSVWQNNGSLWGSLFINLLSSAIVLLIIILITAIQLPSIAEYAQRARQLDELGTLPQFWQTSNQHHKYTIIAGKEPASLDPHEPEPRIGYAESFAILLITQLLHQLGTRKEDIIVELVGEKEILSKDWFEGHTIMLGSELSIQKFRDISLAAGVPCYQFDLHREQLPRTFGEIIEQEYTPKFRSKTDRSETDPSRLSLIRDYGTVSRIRRPGDRLLVLLNGNYGAGLLAATLAVTRRDNADASFALGNFFLKNNAQEIVVEVSGMKDHLLRPYDQILIPSAWPDWRRFDADISRLETEIEECCRPSTWT